ncbi:MAG: hypothetical protein WCJ18_00720 [Planctomycetota bacterium]
MLGVHVIVNQHCRIGRLAMVGASAYVSQDVAPCVLIDGRTGGAVGLNTVGLLRHGIDAKTIVKLKQAYRRIFRSGISQDRLLAELAASDCRQVGQLRQFIGTSVRGLAKDRRRLREFADGSGDGHPETLPLLRRRAA